MINSTDLLAYNSPLRKCSGLAKLYFFFTTLIILMFCDTFIIPTFVLVIIIFKLILECKVAPVKLLKMTTVPLIFILTALIPVIFSIGPSFISSFNYSETGFKKAVIIGVKSIASVSLFFFLILTTPVVQLNRVFKRLKISPLLCELIILIYRYIFLFFETASIIHLSQKSRMGYSNFKNSLKSTGQLVSSLFVKSFSHSKAAYNALRGRGFHGDFIFLEEETDKKKSLSIFYYLFPLLILFLLVGEKIWLL